MKLTKDAKRKTVSIFAAVCAITLAVMSGKAIYSYAKERLYMCDFASGISHSNVAALVKESTESTGESAYSMTPEENARFYGQWEKGYAADNDIALNSSFDESSYNTDTEIYELLNSFDARIWLNKHKYNHEKEIFESISYNDFVNDTYSEELNLKKILEENGFSNTVYTTDFLYFKETWEDGQCFNSFTIMPNIVADMFNYKSANGENLNAVVSNKDYIEAVAVGVDDDFLNKEFEVCLYNYKEDTYENKTVKIVGILDSPYYAFNITSYSTDDEDYTLESFICENSPDKPKLLIDTFDGYEKYSYYANKTSGYYYINLDETDVSKLSNVLSDNGYNLIKLKDVYHRSYSVGLSMTFSSKGVIVVSVSFILAVSAIITIAITLKKPKEQKYELVS